MKHLELCLAKEDLENVFRPVDRALCQLVADFVDLVWLARRRLP